MAAMSWIWILGIAVAVIAVASVLGAQPKGGRPVSRTHLMGVARFVLIIAGLIIGFLIFRARSHR
jgi:putative Mn2+ efflux pump MntP